MKKINKFYLLLLLFFFVSSCTETLDHNLGNGYFLTGYGINTEICKNGTSKGVDEILLGEIADYAFNDSFILIYRTISDEVKNHFNDHPYNEIMRGGDSIQYWIIQKKDGKIIGPLHKEEYLLKRKELVIPNSIQLKE